MSPTNKEKLASWRNVEAGANKRVKQLKKERPALVQQKQEFERSRKPPLRLEEAQAALEEAEKDLETERGFLRKAEETGDTFIRDVNPALDMTINEFNEKIIAPAEQLVAELRQQVSNFPELKYLRDSQIDADKNKLRSIRQAIGDSEGTGTDILHREALEENERRDVREQEAVERMTKRAKEEYHGVTRAQQEVSAIAEAEQRDKTLLGKVRNFFGIRTRPRDVLHERALRTDQGAEEEE